VNLQKAIVSKYIIADIFGLLGKDKKLKVITYSTKMKKILRICLDDYKKRSVKIFVGERNGIGKEFNVNGKLCDILFIDGLTGACNDTKVQYNVYHIKEKKKKKQIENAITHVKSSAFTEFASINFNVKKNQKIIMI